MPFDSHWTHFRVNSFPPHFVLQLRVNTRSNMSILFETCQYGLNHSFFCFCSIVSSRCVPISTTTVCQVSRFRRLTQISSSAVLGITRSNSGMCRLANANQLSMGTWIGIFFSENSICAHCCIWLVYSLLASTVCQALRFRQKTPTSSSVVLGIRRSNSGKCLLENAFVRWLGTRTCKFLVPVLSICMLIWVMTTHMFPHSRVTSVAWNCSGTHLASGSYDKTVQIWSIGSISTFECESTVNQNSDMWVSLKPFLVPFLTFRTFFWKPSFFIVDLWLDFWHLQPVKCGIFVKDFANRPQPRHHPEGTQRQGWLYLRLWWPRRARGISESRVSGNGTLEDVRNAYIHTHTHICLLHACVCIFVHTYTYTYMCTYMHTCIHTNMNTYIHEYIHTWIHTYMYT